MSRRQQDAERMRRMTGALDRDPATQRWAQHGVARLEALANHPAARSLTAPGRDFGPPEPSPWTPTPDPAHAAPNRSILRDLWSLARKAFR